MPSLTTAPPHAAVEVEVRYAETDQMGVAHHANYLVWFELARTHLCAATGHTYSEIEAMGYFLTVTGAGATYRRPARYGDRLLVECQLDRLGTRGMRFVYRVLKDGALVADGWTDHVWLDAASRRPCRTPEAVRPGFARLEAGGI